MKKTSCINLLEMKLDLKECSQRAITFIDQEALKEYEDFKHNKYKEAEEKYQKELEYKRYLELKEKYENK